MLIVFLSLVTLLAGLLLLQAGWWPDRSGATPHCRRCDYNLTGIYNSICPECGTVLAGGNRELGDRHRRPYLGVLGLLLLVVGLSPWALLTAQSLRSIHWQRYRPTPWLLDDLASTDATRQQSAWEELARRDAAGKLPPAAWTRMIDLCLQSQASPAPDPFKIEYLRYCFANSRLSPAQQQALFQNMIPQALFLPRQALIGAPVHCGLVPDPRRIPKIFEIRLCNVSLVQGGDPTSNPSWSCRGIWRRFSTTSRTGDANPVTFVCDQPGTHGITLQATVEIRRWVDSLQEDGQLYYSGPLTLTGRIDAVSMDSLNRLIVTDPSMADTLAARIHLDYPTLSSHVSDSAIPSGMHMLTCWRGNEALPVSVVFDVIARVQGREYPIDHFICWENVAHPQTRVAAVYPGPATEKMDIILRTSPSLVRAQLAAALQTNSLPKQIWQGEITYKDVPIRLLDAPPPTE